MAIKVADSSAKNRQDQKLNPWYLAEKNKAHERLVATVMHLRNRQPAASKQNWHNFRLYAGFEQPSFAGGRTQQQILPTVYDRFKLSVNVARRCVDTVHSRIIQNKPKPQPLTVGGEFGQVQKAKMFDQLGQGMFYHAKVYNKTFEAAKDAEIFGTGAIQCTEGWDGKPECERIFIDEIMVDEADGLYREPRCLFTYRPVDKQKLLDNPKYKKFKDQIKNAALPEENGMMIIRNSIFEQAGYYEAWQRPSNPYAKGRHIIALSNVTLVDEPWEYDYFPIVFLRFNERSLGFFGQGICEQVSGIQFEVSALLSKVQEQMRLSGPKVFIERGANIVQQHISNELWGIIEYSGQAPVFSVFQAVAPEQFEQLDRLVQSAFQEIGASTLSAHGEKPAGLNSGKALLTFNDLETSNYAPFGTRFEEIHLDIFKRFTDIARNSKMMPDEKGKPQTATYRYPVKTRTSSFLREIKWSDVDIENDEFTLQIFPTSFLPNTPAGKLQAIGDMIDRGMLKGDEAVSLLDFPDLNRVTDLITAAIDDIDMMIEEMLENGLPLTPEPFSNNRLALDRMNSAYLRAKVNKYPEERLQLVRDYIEAADSLVNPPAPPGAPPQQGAPSMGTPALPNGMQAPPTAVQGAPGMGLAA